MTRIILTYGLISGLVIISGILGTSIIGEHDHGSASLWLGYLIMLVALSSILVGVKQHRDQALGGVIRFWPAFGLGVAIALVATLAYVVVWEIYLASTDYAFMQKYTDQMLAAKRASGVTGAAYAKAAAEAQAMVEQYRNPIYRFFMTAAEILPVGLLVALVSAALVRNPRFLPSRSRSAPVAA